MATDPSAQAVAATETDGSIAVQGDAASALPLQAWGVLNGASLLPGPVAPGEIVTLFGAAIGPASVLFDGVPAPILYSGPSQINLVVPFEVQNKPNTQVQVVQGTQTVAQLQVPVADASPAIFAADGSGAGAGAILNQDYSLNTPSTPAAKGSVVMIFATGAGQTDPQPARSNSSDPVNGRGSCRLPVGPIVAFSLSVVTHGTLGLLDRCG